MTPIADLQRTHGMSPRGSSALTKAGIETAEAAAALTDAELLAIRFFKAASLKALRAWQASVSGAAKPAIGPTRLPGESPLAEKLLVELARTKQWSGRLMADVAWEAADRFTQHQEERANGSVRGDRPDAQAGGAGERPGSDTDEAPPEPL